MRKILFSILTVISASVLLPTNASAFLFYGNDFQSSIVSGWSDAPISITPNGSNHFLGLFQNQTTELSLTGLPYPGTATVAFDLYVIGTWDGNAPMPEAGPDIWSFGVGATKLIETTFGQWYGFSNDYGQAYPGEYPTGVYPFRSGASSINSLGYTGSYWDSSGDSIYSLSFTFPYGTNDLALNFSGNLSDVAPNENWGIDNIQVSVSPVPEPSTMLLLGAGLLGGVRLRRRSIGV